MLRPAGFYLVLNLSAVQLFTEQKSGKISSAWGFSPVRISKAKELYYLFTLGLFCFPSSHQ